MLRQSQSQCSDSNLADSKIVARAFDELVTHIESSVKSGTFCFKFSALRQMYTNRLDDLGVNKEINKVRFKKQVLRYYPTAKEQSDGKNVCLVFEQGMQKMLKSHQAAENQSDHQEDVETLMKAANIVRNEIFPSSWFKFNASFPPECQQQSVPTTLKLLVTMLLKGNQDFTESQACLTISQTILFNCKKACDSKNANSSMKSRHSLNYEPPLPLYIGLNIHTQTRCKKLIMEMYELGLSISYDRVLQLENQLANAVCDDIDKKGIVCPTQLRKGLFTVGALDNLDHNPSSTTAKDSFHGTGISLFQSPTRSKMGTLQDIISLNDSTRMKKYLLPDHFTIVPAVTLKKEKVEVNESPNSVEVVKGHLDGAKTWLEHAIKLLDKEKEMLLPGQHIMPLCKPPQMICNLLSLSCCHCSMRRLPLPP